jgi:putative membrane protein
MPSSTPSLGASVALAARGFAMGAADVVPGVSGGTMAFILGIYEPLIEATGRLSEPQLWQRLLRFDLRGALDYLDWRFLATVAAGMLIAIFSLAPFLSWALDNHPSMLWAFFFGLVLASIYTVGKRVPDWRPASLVAAAIGAAGAWLLVGLVPVTTPDTWWFLLFSGSIAICAMMLPGISGSFVLVLLGKYQVALEAVNDRNLLTLALLAIGAGLGMLVFARFLSWLLHHFHDLTIATLIGLMAGSLRKVWPWKLTLETTLDRHGHEVPLVQQNVMPVLEPATLLALGLAVAGLALILTLARIEQARAAREAAA